MGVANTDDEYQPDYVASVQSYNVLVFCCGDMYLYFRYICWKKYDILDLTLVVIPPVAQHSAGDISNGFATALNNGCMALMSRKELVSKTALRIEATSNYTPERMIDRTFNLRRLATCTQDIQRYINWLMANLIFHFYTSSTIRVWSNFDLRYIHLFVIHPLAWLHCQWPWLSECVVMTTNLLQLKVLNVIVHLLDRSDQHAEPVAASRSGYLQKDYN